MMYEHDSTNRNTAHQLAQANSDHWLNEEIERVLALGPIAVVAGVPPTGTREGLPVRRFVGDDPELLRITEHVRKPGEKLLLQFYARTGLGPAQLRTMSADEITRFVEVAAASAENQEVEAEAARMYKPQTIPKKFSLGAITRFLF